MVKIKCRVFTTPSHVDVRLFVRDAPDETWALSGKLTFRLKEWVQVLPQLPDSWEFESDNHPDDCAAERTQRLGK